MTRGPLIKFANVMRGTYQPMEDDHPLYDNVMHFLSGAFIAVVAMAGVGLSVVQSMVAFLVLALVWEVYEYLYSIRPWDEREDWTTDRQIEDTMLDIYVGATGAVVVVLLL